MQAMVLEQRMLGLQYDFAMVFERDARHQGGAEGEGGSGSRYTFWLGKVQRLIRVFGRKKTEYRQPVDLANYEGPIHLVAQWYKKVEGADCSALTNVDSVYTLVEPDHKCYDIKHVLAPVQLAVCRVAASGSDSESADAGSIFQYHLSQDDRKAIDAAIAVIVASTTAAATGSNKRKRDTHCQQQADDGRRVVRGNDISSRGRVLSQVQYDH
jgi:hypothetical protein